MGIAYIGLGANLGNRGETMRAALRRMAEHPHLRVERVSHFYETPPWGKTDQPQFLNAAACISFDGSAHELLGVLQRIEYELGRVRHEHWGARTIDLDVLYVEGATCADAALRLPHPYLTERAFVLVPLAEIAPDLMVHGQSAAAWLAAADTEGIVRARELSEPYPVELIAACDEGGGSCSRTAPRIWCIFVGRRWAGSLSWGGVRWRACPHTDRSQDGRMLCSQGRWSGRRAFISCMILRNCGRCSLR